jgi:hypothetical protein
MSGLVRLNTVLQGLHVFFNPLDVDQALCMLQALRRVLAKELDLESLKKHYRRNRQDSFNGPEVENADVLSRLPDVEVAVGKPEGREAEVRQAADFIVHMRVWPSVGILSRFRKGFPRLPSSLEMNAFW